MKIDRIDVEGIEIGERLRPVNAGAVESLAKSLKENGLLCPIKVHQYEPGRCRVVVGAHRVMAARSLGWEFIDGVWVADDTSPEELEMLEIAENLHRMDLTKEERDRQIRRYAELVKARMCNNGDGPDKLSDPSTDSIGRSKSPQQMPGVSSIVAEETGLSQRTVRRALSANDTAKKQAKKAEDKSLKEEATEKLAHFLAEHIDGQHWDALKANLYAAGAKGIAREFERVCGVSVFDNSRAGAA